MFGSSDTGNHASPQFRLPVLVHSLQSGPAWDLAQKIWQANSRNVLQDAMNHKELLHFVFNNPTCAVWLQRDQGRTDTIELILIWQEPVAGLTEVYVLTNRPSQPVGDDARIRSLLASILASPATVPVIGSNAN